MLELAPNDPLIKTYLKDLQHLRSQSVTHELGLKGPFQNLLDKAARRPVDLGTRTLHLLRRQARRPRWHRPRRVPPRPRLVGGQGHLRQARLRNPEETQSRIPRPQYHF